MEDWSTYISVMLVSSVFAMVGSLYCVRKSKKKAILLGISSLVLLCPVIISSQLQQGKPKPSNISWVARVLFIGCLGLAIAFVDSRTTDNLVTELYAYLIEFFINQPTYYEKGFLETPTHRFELSLSWGAVTAGMLMGSLVGALMFENWLFFSVIFGFIGCLLGFVLDASISVRGALYILENDDFDVPYDQFTEECSFYIWLALVSVVLLYSRIKSRRSIDK